MVVHNKLESWPKEHIGPIDIPICGGNLPALQFESETLIKPDAKEKS